MKLGMYFDIRVGVYGGFCTGIYWAKTLRYWFSVRWRYACPTQGLFVNWKSCLSLVTSRVLSLTSFNSFDERVLMSITGTTLSVLLLISSSVCNYYKVSASYHLKQASCAPLKPNYVRMIAHVANLLLDPARFSVRRRDGWLVRAIQLLCFRLSRDDNVVLTTVPHSERIQAHLCVWNLLCTKSRLWKRHIFQFQSKGLHSKDVRKSCIRCTLTRRLLSYYDVLIVNECKPPVDKG